jgi:ketosteroid isomerase-like protein
MSQANMDIVQRMYDAWGRQEFPGPAGLLDGEVEYVNPAGAVEPGTRRGVDEFADAIRRVQESWELWEMEPETLTAVGDQVAVVVRYRSRGRGSGVEVEGRESALWTVRGGKIVRMEWFHGAGDALEAARLPE